MGSSHPHLRPVPSDVPKHLSPNDQELSRDQDIRLPGVGGQAQDDLGVTWQREGQQTLELFQATLGEDSFSVRLRMRTSFQPQA